MTDNTPIDNERGQGRDGALAALLQVAADQQVLQEYPAAIASFDPADYEEIIRLAWSHQFDEDRSKFKRGIQALEEHLSESITARLELGR